MLVEEGIVRLSFSFWEYKTIIHITRDRRPNSWVSCTKACSQGSSSPTGWKGFQTSFSWKISLIAFPKLPTENFRQRLLLLTIAMKNFHYQIHFWETNVSLTFCRNRRANLNLGFFWFRCARGKNGFLLSLRKKIKFEKKKEREWKTKLNQICRAINERAEEVAFLRELEPLPPLLTLLKD